VLDSAGTDRDEWWALVRRRVSWQAEQPLASEGGSEYVVILNCKRLAKMCANSGTLSLLTALRASGRHISVRTAEQIAVNTALL
jgi:hypothetical protein